MLRIQCPNYNICSKYIKVKNNDEKESEFVDRDNVYNKNITCIPVRNKDNTFSLETDFIPVCWECAASYSSIENVSQNKYLSFIDQTECSICFINNKGVSFPNCMHYTCIPCHTRCWFGPKPQDIPFPYSDEIKILYYSDTNNPIWKKDEKVQQYQKENKKIENERMEQWEKETNLRLCPVCRK